MTNANPIPKRLLVAIGGNATHPENITGTSKEQEDIAAATARALLPLTQLENQLIITVGKGLAKSPRSDPESTLPRGEPNLSLKVLHVHSI